MAAFSGPMVVTSKALFKMELCTVLVTMCGRTAACIKATTDLTRSTAKALTPTLMAASTVVSGSTECSTALGASLMPSPLTKGKASGPLVNSNNGLRLRVSDQVHYFKQITLSISLIILGCSNKRRILEF
jgi:hypothetical protein